MKEMSFVTAMKDYFGILPGKTTSDFLQELKALTPEDREYFKKRLETVGYKVVQLG